MTHAIRISFVALFSALSIQLSCCFAQADKTTSAEAAGQTHQEESSTDLAAIRAGADTFTAAFNQGDAKALAALWTEDGEYVDESGTTYTGRGEIEKVYADFFAENPGQQIKVIVDSLRQLSDCAAIEDGRAMLEPAPPGTPAIGKYLAVHVKVDGKWLMASVRDSRIETSSMNQNVADLEWLIGTWTAEDRGTTTESICRWVANKTFVERRYTVTQVDGTKTSGVQLIGWNPQANCVQSWNFSPDGGHAVGMWSPIEGGWTAEMQGMTGDGTISTATNILKKLDENAYVWQSVERSLGGLALPDTDEVVLKRQKTSN